jgi:hypothetical protein
MGGLRLSVACLAISLTLVVAPTAPEDRELPLLPPRPKPFHLLLSVSGQGPRHFCPRQAKKTYTRSIPVLMIGWLTDAALRNLYELTNGTYWREGFTWTYVRAHPTNFQYCSCSCCSFSYSCCSSSCYCFS